MVVKKLPTLGELRALVAPYYPEYADHIDEMDRDELITLALCVVIKKVRHL